MRAIFNTEYTILNIEENLIRHIQFRYNHKIKLSVRNRLAYRALSTLNSYSFFFASNIN